MSVWVGGMPLLSNQWVHDVSRGEQEEFDGCRGSGAGEKGWSDIDRGGVGEGEDSVGAAG